LAGHWLHEIPAVRNLPSLIALGAALCAPLCTPVLAQSVVSASARALHERVLTLDTHLDTTAKMDDPKWDVMERHGLEDGQVDFPRMREGGLDGGFWAIYTAQQGRTPADYRVARDNGLKRLINIHKMIAAHPDRFELALTADDARRIVAAGKSPAFISMENASPLTLDPVPLLRFYYSQGLRMMSLVHTSNNEFADSANTPAQWQGMSPAGKELVAEANRLGIVVDQSHASDAVFDQLIEMSKAPIILSHSGAADVYRHPRNIDDARLKKLAEKGGVIQMNALGAYLIDTGETPQLRAELRAATAKFAAMPSGPERESAVAAARAEVMKRNNVKQATLDDYLRHVDHVLKLIGPDHVGFGADWDGGGGVVGLEDITSLPKITQWLVDRGYTEQQIANIWGGNVLRVMEEARKVARTLQTPTQ
jgi:membrane dipeptidase